MDRGGTITWYLNANDTNFQVTVRKVREEAKRTGKSVERDFGKGIKSGKLSLDDFSRSLSRSASHFRNFQIATRGFELNAMIVGATLASGAIIELAGAISALAGLLTLIPAGIGVAASAIATLKIATFGVGDAFKELIKPVKGATVAQSLAKKQSDITARAMKRDASLVDRLGTLNKRYGDTLRELADERMRKLNEQILRGVDAWEKISDAAASYLDVSEGLNNLNLEVAQAQAALTSAVMNYGSASQQATEASRDLFAAQGKLSQANADLDENFNDIRNNVKDLATNLNSLRKANRNQMKATLANLKALRLDKKARGESTVEADRMIAVLEQLGNIKDINLGSNLNLGAAQAQLDNLKSAYPDIAVAAQEAASSTEKSLTASLRNIAESMQDVRKERAELATELKQSLAEAAEQSAVGQQGKDPFEGLSRNARLFVIALKDVYDAFQPIKNDIQDKFFAGLDLEIRNVAAVTFPILKKGLGEIATAMNGMAKEASRVIQQPFFTGALENSMSTTAQATRILTAAVEPLARVFTDLMNIGNPYVIMLSEWVVKQTELAAAFTSSAEGQQKLKEGIDLGIIALKQIGGLIGAVTGLFYDLFRVSNEAGFSLIGTLTETVNKMRDWIKADADAATGQQKLRALFEATETVLQKLFDVLGAIIDKLLGIVKVYNELDGPAKSLITNMIVFGAIATPILTYVSSQIASLQLVFIGLREVLQFVGIDVKKLAGAFKGPLNSAFGLISKHPILAIIGLLAAVFLYLGTQTDVFQKAFEQLKPTFDAVGEALGPVMDALGQMAKDLGEAILPIIPILAEVFGQILAALLPLIPPLLELVMTLLPVMVQILQAVVAVIVFLMPIILTLVKILGAILVGAVTVVVGIMKGFIAVIQWLADIFAGTFNWIKENWPLLLAILTGPIGLAVYTIVKNWDSIKNAFSKAWEFIKSIWGGVGHWFSSVGFRIKQIFYNVKNGIINAFWHAIEWIKGLPGRILRGLSNLKNMLWDSGWSLIMGLWRGISQAFSNVKKWVKERLTSIRNLFPFSPAKEGPFSGMGYTENSGVALMRDFGEGIVSMGSKVLNQTESIIGDVAGAFTGLASDVGAMQTDFGLNANATMAADMSGLAPAVMDSREGTSEIGTSAPVVINQTNEVHTDLDMEQVNRNLAWEMNKL